MNDTKQQLINLLQKYANGEETRSNVLSWVNTQDNTTLANLPEESKIYHVLTLYDDPEDANIFISRKGIINILTSYLSGRLEKKDLCIWASDVLDFNASGYEKEQHLVNDILFTLDNFDINEIDNNYLTFLLDVLKKTEDPSQVSNIINSKESRK